LTFFANPALGDCGVADVTCDLRVVRPDGSTSINEQNATCFRGQVKGNPMNLYLSGPVLGFVGEPSDIAGIWKVEVILKDNRRKVELPLTTFFKLL
jgi:hypothetical protein